MVNPTCFLAAHIIPCDAAHLSYHNGILPRRGWLTGIRTKLEIIGPGSVTSGRSCSYPVIHPIKPLVIAPTPSLLNNGNGATQSSLLVPSSYASQIQAPRFRLLFSLTQLIREKKENLCHPCHQRSKTLLLIWKAPVSCQRPHSVGHTPTVRRTIC